MNINLQQEYLFTNHFGGYVSGCLDGVNRRKYHGLLNSGFNEEGNRTNLLATLEERIIVGQQSFFLSSHEYEGRVVHPDGRELIRSVGQNNDGIYWRFDLGIGVIEKTLSFPRDREQVQLSYRWLQAPKEKNVRLELVPLLAGRNIHQVAHRPSAAERKTGGAFFHLDPKKLTRKKVLFSTEQGQLELAISAGEFQEANNWFYHFHYQTEEQRGYPAIEDLWQPGVFTSYFPGHRKVHLATKWNSKDQTRKKQVFTVRSSQARRSRAYSWPESFPCDAQQRIVRWYEKLDQQADDFLVQDQHGQLGIVAGYPWFGIWSRDTFLAFEGLLLSRERLEEARAMLLAWGKTVHGGFLPNILEEEDKRFHFVADASLLFVRSVFQYVKQAADFDLLKELWFAIDDILTSYFTRGAEHWLDQDGLVHFVSDGSKAATWMDAIAGGQAVTPRYGACVEIQAMWFSCLHEFFSMANEKKWNSPLVEKIMDVGGGSAFIHQLGEAIGQRFANKEHASLADVVTESDADFSVRPNQLWAISLCPELFPASVRDQVFVQVEEQLLTKAGLRTLSPKSEEYQGQYQGDQFTRDQAYHQGTVWPWLLGVYGDGLLAHAEDAASSLSVQQAELKILNVCDQLFAYCDHLDLRFIPEVFSGDDFLPNGTIHQAWNVGQIFAMLRHVLEK